MTDDKLRPVLLRRVFAAALLVTAAGAFSLPAEAKKGARTADESEDHGDEALAKRHQIPLSGVAYLVIDAKTGKVLEQRQAAEPFVPASSIKIASTLAALVVLGADHRFVTEIAATGTVSGGTLAGDLYLKGGGDPMLTTDDMEAMVHALKTQGITRVSGRFVYDSSAYTTIKSIDRDYEDSASYNPGIAALSVNFNVLKLKWQREGKNATTTNLQFFAQTDHHEVEVSYLKGALAQPGTTGPYGLAYREESGKPIWYVLPAKKPKGEITIPVKQPDFSAAHVFKKIADKAGVALTDPVAGTAPASARVLHRHSSKPLPEIVQRVQRFSNNMAAEMLGLAAARKLTGKTLSIGEAAAALAGWWKQKLPSVNWAGYDVRNSSGLTKETKITPEQMVALLRYAQTLRFGSQSYADLLRPFFVGKVDGDEDADAGSGRKNGKGRDQVEVKAKTGTVNYSRAVAGYMKTRQGHEVIFAVFVSDYKVREVAGKSGEPAAKLVPHRRWNSISRELQRSLVRRWAEKL